jgi:hypothetical protein
MNSRYLYGRIRIDMEQIAADERRETARKKHFYARMKAMGIRGTSIQKYLRRGFPGPFIKALRSEMEQMVTDIRKELAA